MMFRYNPSCVFLCCATIVMLAPAPVLAMKTNDADKDAGFQAATTLTDQATDLSRKRQYDAAADKYTKAIAGWKQYLVDHAGDSEARKKLAHCERDLVYCLDQPIRRAMSDARSRIKDGDVRAGSDAYLEAAKQYANASTTIDASSFRNNRLYCLDRAALEPIRYADKLDEQGKFGAAVEFYELGLERYAYAHSQLGENRFSRNVKYATQRLARCRFADRLARHAPAPDFNLESPHGEPVQLSAFRGKPVLLVLWAGWCGACRTELLELEALYQDSASRGLVVLGICLDSVKDWDRGRRADAEKLMNDELTFPVAWATDDTVRDYGSPNAVPTLIWIDSQGNLVRQIPSDEVRIIRLLREFEALGAGH